MSGLFRYSIIRFRPFAETGEFANIGVLVTDLATGQSAFRLAAKRFTRVKNFFDDAYDSYRKASGYLRTELERAVREAPLLSDSSDDFFYRNLVRERESSIVFAPPRVLKSRDNIQAVTEALYNRYIGRNFDISENVEATLTKKLRADLKDRGVTYLRTLRVEDDVAPIILPLAYHADEFYAIKPLAFSQKTPLAILDHGSNWKTRFEYLLDKGRLKKKNVLLAIDPPKNDDDAFHEAYDIVMNDLSDLPFEKVSTENSQMMEEMILDFTSRIPLDTRIMTRH